MRSADLTGAAQIRETAMQLFAERGMAAVSVRDIAAAAGVSPSLVIHHYGSKEGLKAAVDERATQVLIDLVSQFTAAETGDAAGSSIAALIADRIGELSPIVPYLRRLLVDGGPGAGQLFRTLYESTLAMMANFAVAGVVKASADERVRAAVLLVNDLAALVLRDQIAAVVGFDPLAGPGAQRWGAALMEIYSAGIFTVPEGGPS